MPPINIKVRDHRAFGRKPIVGTSCIKALAPYRVDPLADQAAAEGEMSENPGLILIVMLLLYSVSQLTWDGKKCELLWQVFIPCIQIYTICVMHLPSYV